MGNAIAAVVLLAGLMLMTALPGCAKAPCSERVSALGSYSTLRWKARESARTAWATKVGSSFGDAHASWRTAKGKRVVCKRARTRLYVCLASARPCAPAI